MFAVLKFLHVLSAMIWVGGLLAVIVISTRLGRSQNRAATEALAQQVGFYGRAVLGPAAGATFLFGLATAAIGHIPFSTLWILWGFVGILGSLLIGAIFVNRTASQLGRAASSPSSDKSTIPTLQRRLATLNLANLVLLISVVAAMVIKP